VQIVQDELTRLTLRVVPGRDWNEGSIRTARTLTATVFGPRMELDVETVAAIPQEASGKYRFCISHVAAKAGGRA
jgi:phenylacetate-CoA ligase